MSEASHTFIADPETAKHALANLAARAELLDETVSRLTGDIAALEGNRPWGTAEEFGGRFERVYHAGQGGAEFVRSQAGVLAERTRHGVTTAYGAVQASVELDQQGAALFTTADSDAIGQTLAGIGQARAGEVAAQQADQ